MKFSFLWQCCGVLVLLLLVAVLEGAADMIMSSNRSGRYLKLFNSCRDEVVSDIMDTSSQLKSGGPFFLTLNQDITVGAKKEK